MVVAAFAAPAKVRTRAWAINACASLIVMARSVVVMVAAEVVVAARAERPAQRAGHRVIVPLSVRLVQEVFALAPTR